MRNCVPERLKARACESQKLAGLRFSIRRTGIESVYGHGHVYVYDPDSQTPLFGLSYLQHLLQREAPQTTLASAAGPGTRPALRAFVAVSKRLS